MGRLADLNAQLERLQNPEKYAETEDRVDWGEYVEAITSSIVDLTERLEAATQANKPDEAKDHSKALKALARSLADAQSQVADKIVEAIRGIDFPAPVVNVPEIEIEQSGPMQFDIERDRDGLIQRVIARPYEPTPVEGKTYEME